MNGQALIIYRKQLKLTQRDMAALLAMPLSTYRHREKGSGEITPGQIVALADALRSARAQLLLKRKPTALKESEGEPR